MTSPALALQPRAIGRLDIEAGLRRGKPALTRLHQGGALRALFPQGRGLTAVMLNTSGGVTGGDSFTTHITAAQGADLTVSTQAAERIYRAQPGETGVVRSQLTLAEGARLHWVPQETILFDGAALDRRLRVDMAGDAHLVLVEPMIFGRAAMGETVRAGRLLDRIEVFRGGELVFADRVALSGDIAATLAHQAVAAGAGAQAALVLITPQAERHLDRLRRLMPEAGGASLIRPGVVFARVLAEDGFALRKTLIPALAALEVALPRVWSL